MTSLSIMFDEIMAVIPETVGVVMFRLPSPNKWDAEKAGMWCAGFIACGDYITRDTLDCGLYPYGEGSTITEALGALKKLIEKMKEPPLVHLRGAAMCECGHDLEHHDARDEGRGACLKCACSEYVEAAFIDASRGYHWPEE